MSDDEGWIKKKKKKDPAEDSEKKFTKNPFRQFNYSTDTDQEIISIDDTPTPRKKSSSRIINTDSSVKFNSRSRLKKRKAIESSDEDASEDEINVSGTSQVANDHAIAKLLQKEEEEEEDDDVVYATSDEDVTKPAKHSVKSDMELARRLQAEEDAASKTRTSRRKQHAISSSESEDETPLKPKLKRSRLKKSSKSAKQPKKKRVIVLDSDSEDDESDTKDSDLDLGYHDVDDGVSKSVENLFTVCEDLSRQLINSKEQKQLKFFNVDEEDHNSTINSETSTIYDEDENIITAEEANNLFEDKSVKLKHYQLIGLNWMHLLYKSKVNGILADEMGLGKTVQSLAILAFVYRRYNIRGPHCIIVPSSTLDNWKREADKWLSFLKVYTYQGSEAERSKIRRKLKRDKYDNTVKFDVLIATYNTFQGSSANSAEDRQFFYSFKWNYLICDEGHNLKNRTSQRYLKMSKIKAKHKLILSGTPVQNNVKELFNLFAFLNPKIFDTNDEELCEFFDGNYKSNTNAVELNHVRIRKTVRPFILRRLKLNVLNEFPKKTQEILKLQLEGKQKAIYDAIVQRYLKRKEESKKNITSKSSVELSTKEQSSVFTELRKAANHPLLVRSTFGKVEDGIDRRMDTVCQLLFQVNAFGARASMSMIKDEVSGYSDWDLHLLTMEYGSRNKQLRDMGLSADHLLHSVKMKKLKELVPSLIQQGDRMLIFSQWTCILDIIEELVQAEFKTEYLRIDGQTSVRERQDLVDVFNSEPKYKLFLLSTRSGGLGLNLTGANVVIMYDIDWNPTIDQQSEDRAHRIGQSKDVKVFKFICQDTVDEGILKAQEEKKQLDAAMLKDLTTAASTVNDKVYQSKISKIMDSIH